MSTAARNLPLIVFMRFLPFGLCGWIVAKAAVAFIVSIFRVYVECVKKP